MRSGHCGQAWRRCGQAGGPDPVPHVRVLWWPGDRWVRHPYSSEKLGLILAYYVGDSAEAVLRRCVEILEYRRARATFAIHTEDADTAKRFAAAVPASRVLVNTPPPWAASGHHLPVPRPYPGVRGGRSSSSNNIGPWISSTSAGGLGRQRSWRSCGATARDRYALCRG